MMCIILVFLDLLAVINFSFFYTENGLYMIYTSVDGDQIKNPPYDLEITR